MTLFKSTDGLVCGQPISPFFGAQNGAQGAGAVVIPSPAASPNSGVQQPIAAAVATGSVPRNALATSINGTAVGAGDNCSVDELISNGNGPPALLGTSKTPSGGVNDQNFTGQLTGVAMQENGPTTVNNEVQPLGPVSSAVLTSNIALTPNGFQG
jgi:hypothetical protein